MYTIYAHVNKTNGKMYIGQTSVKPEERWKNGNAYKNSRYFSNAIEKYGWDGFEHIILHSNLTKEQADLIEEELIKQYDTTNRAKGYNIRHGGNNSRYNDESKRLISEHHADVSGRNNPFYGKHHSDELKEMLRQKFTGRKPTRTGTMSEEAKQKMRNNHYDCTGANNPRARKINQYDLDGNFIRSYWGCMEVKEICGFDNSGIAKCCKGKVKTSYGYIWRYADDK